MTGWNTDDYRDTIGDPTLPFGPLSASYSSQALPGTGVIGPVSAAETTGDHDLFQVSLRGGVRHVVDIWGADAGLGTLAHAAVRVLDSSGNALPQYFGNEVTFTTPGAPDTMATYFIEARSYLGDTGSYTLNVNGAGTASVADATVIEGDAGYRYAHVAVNFDTGVAFSFNYATLDGSATAGSDYVDQTGGSISVFGRGTTYIDIPIIGDTLNEGNETFSVVLTNPTNGARITGGPAQVTIVNEVPAIYSNGGGDTAAVHIAVGSTLVSTLAAYQQFEYGGQLLWSISGGEDAGLFELRNGNELHFRNPVSLLDAGATPGYQVSVQVDDGEGGIDTQALDITINPLAVTPTAGNAPAYTEQQASPPLIDAGLSVADLDGTTLVGAMVTIAAGFVSGDRLGDSVGNDFRRSECTCRC